MVKTQNTIASLKITIHTFTQNHIFLIFTNHVQVIKFIYIFTKKLCFISRINMIINPENSANIDKK